DKKNHRCPLRKTSRLHSKINMFKWDPCGLVCVCMIYLLIAYADYVILIWMLLPTFGHSIWTVFHGIVFNALLTTTLVAHFRAMLSDPGVVPISGAKVPKENTQESSDEDESDEEAAFRRDNFNRPSATEWTMCTRCDSLRPPRAHHCRVVSGVYAKWIIIVRFYTIRIRKIVSLAC
uniref:Protein S-acyltransferase n=2 Tax=Caenorhabditis japonica TaxID=281687 RepID=A0A8R1EDI1_CAEJA